MDEKLIKVKGSPIALYGLGIESEKFLAEYGREFQIVGLLDGFREEGSLYGKEIIPLSKVPEYGVKWILVIARPGSCRAIAKRIGKFCIENGISLIDIRGRDLCSRDKVSFGFDNKEGITRGQLLAQAGAKEVISVDLFDTLIMRKVFMPEDVIELVACRLRERNLGIEDFVRRRLQAEKELSGSKAPALEEIYELVLERSGNTAVTAVELAQLEWEIDRELFVPRRAMVELLEELSAQGKKIYVVTDTYYTRERLNCILDLCGITFCADVLASCEYGTGKTQDLFEILKKRISGAECLHIGDDLKADMESAKEHGLSACHICSALELMEMLGYLGMWEHADRLSARIKIGMFAARLFNSPFPFEKKEGRIAVSDADSIGYLFAAPLISDFTVWFHEQVKSMPFANVWFGARDGYLVKKLYDRMSGEPSSVYFLTSRMAAIRAGLADSDDIAYVAAMKFSGDLRQQLKVRFGIFVEEAEADGKELQDFEGQILAKAAQARKNYRAYIDTLPMRQGEMAFFDFVAKGTSQMYIGRLVDHPIKGLYFLQLEKEYMRQKDLDITAFYEDIDTDGIAIYEDYYILETILTSPDPSVAGFEEDGTACYAEETRSQRDIQCIQGVQTGVEEYFDSYLKICPESEKGIDKELDELLLGLIHKFDIANDAFLNLKVEDPFFNRMTDLKDIL